MAPLALLSGAAATAGWGAVAAPEGLLVSVDAQPAVRARAPAASQGMIRMGSNLPNGRVPASCARVMAVHPRKWPPSAVQHPTWTRAAWRRSVPAETARPHSRGRSMDARRLVETDIPARLDRLPWSAWHWRVVVALGVTWVLDGLEVTLVGAVAGALVRPDTLALTEQEIGAAATAYLAGAILGALVFGRLTDLVGRKRLFLVTLSVYLGATLLTALSTGFVTFALC